MDIEKLWDRGAFALADEMEARWREQLSAHNYRKSCLERLISANIVDVCDRYVKRFMQAALQTDVRLTFYDKGGPPLCGFQNFNNAEMVLSRDATPWSAICRTKPNSDHALSRVVGLMIRCMSRKRMGEAVETRILLEILHMSGHLPKWGGTGKNGHDGYPSVQLIVH